MILARITLIVFLARISFQQTPQDHPYFVNQIFHRYGDDEHLSFEGFEHLMENLGLGGLKFSDKHNLSSHKVPGMRQFLELHQKLNIHSHNRSRIIRSIPSSKGIEEGCLRAEELLVLYGLEPHSVAISPQGFMHICPAIVYQLDRRSCLPSSPVEKLIQPSNSATYQAWLAASVSILVISVSGLVGVAIVPLIEKKLFRRVLSTLVALAVGTLCGDALLHLLPHAYGLDDNEQVIMMSSATFVVLMLFFLIEAAIHGKQINKRKAKRKKQDKGDYVKVSKEEPKEEKQDEGGIASVAWMVVSGDGLHNLTDGLAVGAAFRADLVAGLATAIAVLTHELPHELGDFAVLLKSGMSVKKAIYYNIFSSVLSFIGMALGIMIGNIRWATSWIYCATAGSFLYIGLADLVPELLKYLKDGDTLITILLQLLGMFTGGVIMFIIAMYEHSLHRLLASSET